MKILTLVQTTSQRHLLYFSGGDFISVRLGFEDRQSSLIARGTHTVRCSHELINQLDLAEPNCGSPLENKAMHAPFFATHEAKFTGR